MRRLFVVIVDEQGQNGTFVWTRGYTKEAMETIVPVREKSSNRKCCENEVPGKPYRISSLLPCLLKHAVYSFFSIFDILLFLLFF